MFRVDLDRRWRVHLIGDAPTARSPASAWESISDLAVFATRDPFHRRIRGAPLDRVGTEIVIEHGFLGLRFDRVGRILRWEPGVGVAFSDLSRRGPDRGFPHLYRSTVLRGPRAGSIVRLEVIGRWTARWIPRPIVRAWLAAVLGGAVFAVVLHLRRRGTGDRGGCRSNCDSSDTIRPRTPGRRSRRTPEEGGHRRSGGGNESSGADPGR